MFSLSQDIESAMERLVDMSSCTDISTDGLASENFGPPDLLHDELLLNEGIFGKISLIVNALS